jgi:tyrosine-protein kinase Etk/Wzc
MNRNQKTMTQQVQEEPEISTSIVEFLEVLARYRKFISRFVLLVTVAAICVTLLLPKWYKSSSSVFPAEKTDLFGALEGVTSLAKNLSPARALSRLGANPEADRYMAILKSSTVLGSVIEKFRLDSVYGITSYKAEKTTKELLGNVEFSIEDEGNITISVFDQDPQRASDMANFFVEMLNKTNTALQSQNAKSNRQFVEERYNKNVRDLAAAEDSLKAFQMRYGVIAMPQQTEASLKAAAEIAGRLAFKEVQAGVLRRTLAPDNPEANTLQVEIDELKAKLSQMNTGTRAKESEMKIFVPFNKVPDYGGEYLRRLREVEIQYKILQFITPVYEQAKVEEFRQTPSVIVLDRAAPAERKSKPKVSLYALIAFTVSVMAALGLVFMLELVRKLEARQPERMMNVRNAIRSDWFGLRSSRERHS